MGRKYFHLVLGLIAIPGLLWSSDFLFLCIAWLVAVEGYILLEAARIANLFHCRHKVDAIVFKFTDIRDRGGVYLTPFYLVLGTAVTFFMELVVGATHEAPLSIVRASLGVSATCLGDSMAAILGSLNFGNLPRYTLPGTRGQKSWQGSVAFLLAYIFGSSLLAIFEGDNVATSLRAMVISGVIAAITEGYTPNIDNMYISVAAFITMYWLT